MHRKANGHPAVFGSERQFRLTVQSLDLIFGGKVERKSASVVGDCPAVVLRSWLKIERPCQIEQKPPQARPVANALGLNPANSRHQPSPT